jgi:two-component system, OmpR family, KDP operon response regulator KdpE
MNESRFRVLIADNERAIRSFLHTSLSGRYTVLEAATGQETLVEAALSQPHAILLDLGLPDLDGIEVLRRLREWTQIPVIVVSVRQREEDKIAAFEAGADDYMVKPFGIGELLARLRVALRRSISPDLDPLFTVRDLTVDLARRNVMVAGHRISMTPVEYDILRVLVQHSGKVMTHQQLIHTVWGSDNEASPHLLRVNISNLRRKIEANPTRPQYILTEPGVGYRLCEIER